MDTKILQELQLQTAIIRIAIRSQIEALSDGLRGDHLTSTIIDTLSDQGRMTAGALWEAVTSADQDAVRRTFNRRLSSLAESGVVRRTGGGRSSSYELTGLVQ